MSASVRTHQSRTASAVFTPARLSYGRRFCDRIVTAEASSLFGLLKAEEAPVTECSQYSGLWARLKQQGLPDQLASLQSTVKKGRGLVAETKIKKGEELLQIPFECALTSATALEGSPLLQKLNANEELDDWTILAVFLGQHRYYKRMTAVDSPQGPTDLFQASGLKREAAEGWAPYINALPSRTGAVLEWTQVELDSVRTTSAAVAAAQVTQSAAAAWQQVEPMLKEAVPELGMSPFAVTEETFRWGVCILLSRLIRLQDEPIVEALVPWADFINHSPASSAYVRSSTGVVGQIGALSSSFGNIQNSLGGMLGGGNDDPTVLARKKRERREKAVASLAGTFINLRADRDFPKGQEVVASYGQKSSGDLLVSYGFVPPPGTNPHDTYKFTLRVSEDDENAAQKEQLLQQYGFGVQQSFPIKWSGWPSALLPYAAFVFSRPEDASDLPELARILLKDGQFPGLDGVDTYELAQESVADALEVVYETLDSSADAKLAETIAMPSTIVPAAAVPVNEDGEEVEVTEEEQTTYVLGALASVRQREKQIIGRTMRLLFEEE